MKRPVAAGALVAAIMAGALALYLANEIAESEIPPVLGAQLGGSVLGDRAQWAVPDRLYHFTVFWNNCELSPGVYTFPDYILDNIAGFKAQLGQGNYKLLIGVKNTPLFYRKYPDYRNSPPLPEYYDEYARFVEALYLHAGEIWGVEVWNEPEGSVIETSQYQDHFGGWGRDGAGYGTMVDVLYHYLRDRGIPLKVVAGASYAFANVDRALTFLRDAKNAGMESDYYSWHGYIEYQEVATDTSAFDKIKWYAIQAYAIYPMPQIISEVSVTYPTTMPESSAHRDRQAEYLTWLLEHKQEMPVQSFLWYTLANNGWEHTDLVFNNIEKPVYQVWIGQYQIYLPIVVRP